MAAERCSLVVLDPHARTPTPNHPGPREGERQPIDIVWNTTLVCPWDCAVCCVDAVHVTKREGQVVLRSLGLQLSESIPVDPARGSIYDQAAHHRQKHGQELTFAEKIQVLGHLDGYTPKIDISGGDPLAVWENYDLLKVASQRFGRAQITLTATGAGLARYTPQDIAPYIGEFNFTVDGTKDHPTDLRPAAYAAANLQRAKQYAMHGVATRAECPLSKQNVDPTVLEQIYVGLHDAGIDKLLVMRLFPSGRGCNVAAATPTVKQHVRAIDHLRTLEARYKRPRVKLQCALRHLENRLASQNPCDMVRESFGLMPDGTLLASPWAVGPKGAPLDDVWVLGNLARQPMTEILQSERAKRFLDRLDDNWGHCKLHAYVNGVHPDRFERMFEASDPLYRSLAQQEVP